MDINTIIQGIILLGAGGITPYLIKVESRLKRLETKQEQSDIDGKKLDLLFDKIAEVKELVMNVKSSLETHARIDKMEKDSILVKKGVELYHSPIISPHTDRHIIMEARI